MTAPTDGKQRTIPEMSSEERTDAFFTEIVVPIISDARIDDDERNLMDAMIQLYLVADPIAKLEGRMEELLRSEDGHKESARDDLLWKAIDKRLDEQDHHQMNPEHLRAIEVWRRNRKVEGDNSFRDAASPLSPETVGVAPEKGGSKPEVWPDDTGPVPSKASPSALTLTYEEHSVSLNSTKKLCRHSVGLDQFGVDIKCWNKEGQMTIEAREGDWYLVPNVSATNETMLNHKAVAEPAKLSGGDLIGIGDESHGIFSPPLTVTMD